MSDDQILIELRRFAGILKVTAVDPHDALEISFQVPARCSRAAIARLARAKLDYVRSRAQADVSSGLRR